MVFGRCSTLIEGLPSSCYGLVNILGGCLRHIGEGLLVSRVDSLELLS